MKQVENFLFAAQLFFIVLIEDKHTVNNDTRGFHLTNIIKEESET